MVNAVVVNLGFGNLYGLQQALLHAGFNSEINCSPKESEKADCIILPGVGSFGNGIKRLKETGWHAVLKNWIEEDKPLLGICLGMQMLFERSYEFGEHQGLNVFQGDIVKISNQNNSKVPKIGWFNLDFQKETELCGLNKDQRVYFVHSYGAQSSNNTHTVAHVEYEGRKYIAAIKKNAIWGSQFHPENSDQNGINYLKSFNNFVKKNES